MNFKSAKEIFDLGKMIFVFGVMVVGTLLARPIFAQTLSITAEPSPVSAEQVRGGNILKTGGYSNKELLPVLKVTLNLTDEQMGELEEISNLHNHLVSMAAHDMPESMPINQNEVKSVKDESYEKAVRLGNELGDEKTYDLCQWIQEETWIRNSLRRLTWHKSDLSNVDELNAQALQKVMDSQFFKDYKNEKVKNFKSKNEADDFFSKHMKNLKLRVSYEVFCIRDENLGMGIRSERKNIEEQKQEVLNRLKISQ